VNERQTTQKLDTSTPERWAETWLARYDADNPDAWFDLPWRGSSDPQQAAFAERTWSLVCDALGLPLDTDEEQPA
jgi:hypothetical protein